MVGGIVLLVTLRRTEKAGNWERCLVLRCMEDTFPNSRLQNRAASTVFQSPANSGGPPGSWREIQLHFSHGLVLYQPGFHLAFVLRETCSWLAKENAVPAVPGNQLVEHPLVVCARHNAPECFLGGTGRDSGERLAKEPAGRISSGGAKKAERRERRARLEAQRARETEGQKG